MVRIHLTQELLNKLVFMRKKLKLNNLKRNNRQKKLNKELTIVLSLYLLIVICILNNIDNKIQQIK